MNSSEVLSHIIFQVFSPAKVIFAGVGVLLSVRILLYPSALAIIVTPLSGSYGYLRKPGHPHRYLRAHGKLLQTS